MNNFFFELNKQKIQDKILLNYFGRDQNYCIYYTLELSMGEFTILDQKLYVCILWPQTCGHISKNLSDKYLCHFQQKKTREKKSNIEDLNDIRDLKNKY